MVMDNEAVLDVPQGQFGLRRFPEQGKATLRAWDSADEYVLRHLSELELDPQGAWLLVNDSFGALAVALADQRPTAMADSVLAHMASRENMLRNGLDDSAVRLLSCLDDPPERVDYLVVKVPKSLALLEDQLRRVRPSLHPETVVVGAGMTRHIHTSTLDLFKAVLGPTVTTRAHRKSRLICTTFDPELDPGPSAYPKSFRIESGYEVVSHAGVFSQRRLDAGTRLLLDNLLVGPDHHDVVDLGCGNGVLGLSVQLAMPDAHITFVDSSFAAVASAEATYAGVFGSAADAAFVVGDSMTGFEDQTVDLVVSNPPFHEDRALGDAVAWQMFTDAWRCLRPGGELRIVGNRHLGYHTKLKRIFKNVEVVASNPKFVVLQSAKAKGR